VNSTLNDRLSFIARLIMIMIEFLIETNVHIYIVLDFVEKAVGRKVMYDLSTNEQESLRRSTV
jgi:hypothetical protein